MKSEEKTRTPLVSIVTATYNHAPYIAEALDSFLAQETEYPYEIIVHDDASTDGTTEIVRNYAEKYPDIVKPIFQKTNQYSQGINIYEFVIPHIRGKYIAQCEGDDFWCDKHKLQKQIAYMEQHPECSYCFCNSYRVNLKSEIIGEQLPAEKSRVFSSREIIAAPEIFLATASTVYKTKDAIGFPPELLAGEAGDVPLRQFLMLKGNAYGFSDKMCCYRVMTPNSFSDRYEQERKYNPKIFMLKNDIYLLAYQRFDAYTNGMYHQELTSKINQKIYIKYMLLADWNSLKKEPFKTMFHDEPFQTQLIVFLKSHFPKLLRIYRRVRYGKEIQLRKEGF